jgi:hypothetical protein
LRAWRTNAIFIAGQRSETLKGQTPIRRRLRPDAAGGALFSFSRVPEGNPGRGRILPRPVHLEEFTCANTPTQSSSFPWRVISRLFLKNAHVPSLRNSPPRPRRAPNPHSIFPGTFPEPATARTVLIRRGVRNQVHAMHAVHAFSPECKRLHAKLCVQKHIINALIRP